MGGGSTVNEIGEDRRVAAETQAKAYNELVAGKPLELAYIKDITADPAGRTATVQGQVNADVMQKIGPARLNPNQSVAGQGMTTPATVLAKAQGNAATDVQMQRLAGTMDLMKMGTGQASTAMTGMEGLAKSATSRAINDAATDFQVKTAQGQAIGSGLALAAYGANKLFTSQDKPKPKPQPKPISVGMAYT